jgi:DNA-binding response OmpR family regulator
MNQPLALIIEDDSRLALIFAEALRNAGYVPEIVGDGRTAETRLQEVVPTLILLDLHLPYLSGDNLLPQIRANEHLAGCVVVLATADAILAETHRSDADLVLLKPISFSQLRDLAIRLRPSQ